MSMQAYLDFFKKVSGVNVSFILVAFLFFISMFVSMVTPPFQSPDEIDHLKRAYLLESGTLILDSPKNSSSGGMIDSGFLVYMDVYDRYTQGLKGNISSDFIDYTTSIKWTGIKEFSSTPGTGYYFPIIYFPQATGLFLGEFFDLSIDSSYKLTRLITLLFSCFILVAAFYFYSPSSISLALLFIPMSVFQFASTSLDSISTAVAVLAISVFLRIVVDREKSKSWLIVFLAVCVFILASSRIHALPLVLLIFGTFFYTRRKICIYAGVITSILIMAWLFFAVKSTVDARVSIGLPVSQIALFYMTNPLLFFDVFLNTLTPNTLDFYVKSFFGRLGALEVRFSDIVYNYLYIIFILIFLFSLRVKSIKGDWFARGLLVIPMVGSIFIIFFALLITWNAHPAAIIQGVQGRYFLIPVLLFSYAVSFGSEFGFSKYCSKILNGFLLSALMAFSFYNTTTRVIDYYYIGLESSDFSKISNHKTEYNPGELVKGRSFEQKFIASESKIAQIRVFLATFSRENSGDILLEILDKNDVCVFSKNIMASKIKDNEWFGAEPRKLSVVKGDYYKIRMTSKNGVLGSSITWWASKNDSYPYGNAIVDSVNLVSDFSFEILFSK
ncbi:DUF2142 domain-containing protein [Thiothrix lacustris]|uniref:DUF2142 domain-containing protein n=1 Tax=Thiothrix lacustris TaxID=525917 RepID=A0ABY9MNJ4_9GAMM|nr:DUF2142 domain-containing protein [Thiothrix lacustris]WML89826.1 DUF2142 domain-containing protein [Thiothrix lacustris]